MSWTRFGSNAQGQGLNQGSKGKLYVENLSNTTQIHWIKLHREMKYSVKTCFAQGLCYPRSRSKSGSRGQIVTPPLLRNYGSESDETSWNIQHNQMVNIQHNQMLYHIYDLNSPAQGKVRIRLNV